MKTFKATVKYQSGNCGVIGRGVNFKAAVTVDQFEVQAPDVWEACELVWVRMNNLDVPVGHPKRGLFEKAGHTSMSVGDFIEFEGHEGVFYCDPMGFVQLKGQELEAVTV